MSEPTGATAEPLSDAEARRAIREDLDTNLVVEAAAGTGKTTMLVERMIALLREGRGRLSRMVAVTFTEKAAGEMKLRLRAELERERQASDVDARARLDEALEELETARIGTIHGLCADLLRERPIEARVDPAFEVDASDATGPHFERVFERWFQRELEDPHEGVRRILRRRGGARSAGPRELLRDAGWSLVSNRDFTRPWTRPDFCRTGLIDRVMDQLDALSDLADQAYDSADKLAEHLAEIRRFSWEVRSRESVTDRDHDGLEAELRFLAKLKSWSAKGRGRFFGPELARDGVLARVDAAKRELDRLMELCDADLAACLREALWPLVGAYAEYKKRAGTLDFLDLLTMTRDLVRDDARVRRELQGTFTHVFIDEFQDTDPLQAEILLLLCASDPEERDFRRALPVPGKLFVVGDPKQSIYRFRRADVWLYEATKRRLVAAGARLLHLSTCFRCVPGIQHIVNATFQAHMHGRETQAAYVPLSRARAEPEGQPSVVALPIPRPYAYSRIGAGAIAKSLPDTVGAFVEHLVRQSGWTVEEQVDGRVRQVPIRPRHICLLFRRFKSFYEDVTRPYAQSLVDRQIPHVLVGGRSFHERDEVLALRNALTAIEWPGDELSVFATLHGALFAVPDDALLAYRHAFRVLSPVRRADPERLTELTAPVEDALAVLRELHHGRNRRPIADTIGRLLDATRAHAGLALWPAGEQALANVQRIMDQARRFEAAGATSFRAFVDHLRREAERNETADSPIVEEGTEGVRIMTVHKAKGLQFPVVILCDPGAPRAHRSPSLHTDPDSGLLAHPLAGCIPLELLEGAAEALRRDEEEGVRVAYVAATRARDLLVVPVVGDEPFASWFDVLNDGLYPRWEDRRSPAPAPGCPPFGPDSVLERPARATAMPGSDVSPGAHRPAAGEHTVVFWDPCALPVGRGPRTGIRGQTLLVPDEAGAAEGLRAHLFWQDRREALRLAGSTPTLAARTVTAAAAAEAAEGLGDGRPVAVEVVATDRAGRPAGKRFGTLVHATLAEVSLAATGAEIARTARAHGRLLGAPNDEVDAAVGAVRSALEHPVLARAGAAMGRGEAFREHPVVMAAADDGSLLEGVVDLLFREEAGSGEHRWVVVDFKTDLEPEDVRPQYVAQVRLYVEAVEAATGEPAAGLLLMV